jgi:hypothetical protein
MAKDDIGIMPVTDALGQKRDWVSVREACEYLDVS